MFPEWGPLAVLAAFVCVVAGEAGDLWTAGAMCALSVSLFAGSV